MLIVPKNWASFQHYKDRSPPWIKLHHELLDDRTFQRLPVASRALAPMLWLLASESKDGAFDASTEELAFRLRTSEKEIDSALKPLIQNGFFLQVQGDSETLAERQQLAVPETEAEAETEPRKARKSKVSADFTPNEAGLAKASAAGIDLKRELERFKDHHAAKGSAMLDWQAAWRTWVGNAVQFGRGGKPANDDPYGLKSAVNGRGQ